MWLEQMRKRGLADADKADVSDLAFERFHRHGELPEVLDDQSRTAFLLDYLASGTWAERPRTTRRNTPAGGMISVTDRDADEQAHDIGAFDLTIGLELRHWRATHTGIIYLQFAASTEDNCPTDLEVRIDLTETSVTTRRQRVDTPHRHNLALTVDTDSNHDLQPYIGTRLLAVWTSERPNITLTLLWSNHRCTTLQRLGDELHQYVDLDPAAALEERPKDTQVLQTHETNRFPRASESRRG